MTDLDSSQREFIRQIVREEVNPPTRAFVVYVYEHTSNSDEWNHEVDLVIKTTGERLYEVPVATPMPGAVVLPNDIGRNFDLSERPEDVDFDDPGKDATEKSDGEKPGNKPKDVDDRPEVLVEYENGDSDSPVVTGFLYSDENRSPIGRANDRRITVGDAVIDIRADENDNQRIELGFRQGGDTGFEPRAVLKPGGAIDVVGAKGGQAIYPSSIAGGGDGGSGDDGSTAAEWSEGAAMPEGGRSDSAG